MKVYADTNFFTFAYLALDGSEQADALINTVPSGRRRALPVTWLLKMEITNAIERYVFINRTAGLSRVTPEATSVAHASFEEDLTMQSLIAPAPLGLTELETEFQRLSRRHTAKHGFRTYDIIHVASAMLLECDTFWSFDRGAIKLAKLEGLKTN